MKRNKSRAKESLVDKTNAASSSNSSSSKCNVCACPGEGEGDSKTNMYLQLMPTEVKQLHVAVMKNDSVTVSSLIEQGQ